MCMLGNVNDAVFLSFFAKNMLAYSDNGVSYNGFYGTRARAHFGIDQLDIVIKTLQGDKDSRQCVVNLWDPADLLKSTKDKACNLCMIFSIVDGRLNMTTYNRSNDAIFGGVTGANIVHFPFFQEFVACALGLPIGPWTHVSNNLHIYVENPKWVGLSSAVENVDYYKLPEFNEHVPLFQSPVTHTMFLGVLDVLLYRMRICVSTGVVLHESSMNIPCPEHFPFLLHTVLPVFNTWICHKHDMPDTAEKYADKIAAKDWGLACRLWLNRRTATTKISA
jgi:hypothetical protein